MTPYYSNSLATLYLGDCRDILPEISAPIVVTDPPYGVSKQPRTYQKKSGNPVGWDSEFVVPALPPNVEALCLMPGISNLVRCPEQIGEMPYRWALSVWVSNGMTRSPVGYGNWIVALMYARDGVKIYRQKSDFAKVSISGKRPDHASPKPIDAMKYLVDMMPDGVICDPYAGSGSTLVAASRLGRRSIGIEIDEQSCEVAAKRLRSEQ